VNQKMLTNFEKFWGVAKNRNSLFGGEVYYFP